MASVEHEQCRFCLEGAAEHPLIAPCNCKGSARYVHLECLRAWQRHRPSRALACPVCRARYTLPPLATLGLLAEQLWLQCAHLASVASAVFAVTAILPLTILLKALLAVASTVCLPHVALMGDMALSFTSEGPRLVRTVPPNPAICRGRLLVATPLIPRGTTFHRGVVLLTAHGVWGSKGLLLTQATEPGAVSGGPVAPWVQTHVYPHRVAGGEEVLEGCYVLEAPDAPPPPGAAMVAHGYSGWAPQQLAGEVASGAWRVVDAPPAGVLLGMRPAGLYDELEGWVARREAEGAGAM